MITIIRLMLIIILLAPLQLKAAGDTSITLAIKANRASLYYPLEVARFYKQNGYKLAWVAPDTIKTQAPDAMLLLDCVRQYGLNHEDYHPRQLLYETLNRLMKQNVMDAEKVGFDVLLTDAMIRFINDLHYGKLNPVYTAERIDRAVNFKANVVLWLALQGTDFLGFINNVQPKSKLYVDLQGDMRLLVGQRSGDCYVIPPSLIRKMAINMERLRWMSTTNKQVHLTCVVSKGVIVEYKDRYHQDKELESALYNEDHLIKPKFTIDEIAPAKL